MKSLKVILDTSALRVFATQVPRKFLALEQAVQDGRVEFYASDPVIAETVNTPEEDRLKLHTTILGRLSNRKYFVPWEGAVYHELCGRSQVLRDGEDEVTMTNFLMGVAHGQAKASITTITQHMEQEKDRLYAYYHSLQLAAQTKFGDDQRTPEDFPYTFEYADQGHWVRQGGNLRHQGKATRKRRSLFHEAGRTPWESVDEAACEAAWYRAVHGISATCGSTARSVSTHAALFAGLLDASLQEHGPK